MSARQVHQSDFVAEVTAALDRHRIDPRNIVLELTETSNLVEVTQAATRL